MTLEACLIMPLILGILLAGVMAVTVVTAVNCLDRALDSTASLLSDYGLLYHEYGLEALENALLSKIGGFIKEKTGDNTAMNVLFKFVNLRECADGADDLLYIKASEVICKYYLDKDPLIKNGYIEPEALSFYGSSFYNNSDDLELYVSCKLFGWLKVGSSIRVRAWVRGDNPLLSLDEAGITVWQLNNFARGKILRTVFGGNLPYDYPVLSAFDSRTGLATVIKSLDVTAPYYRSGSGMQKEIKEMIDKLSNFNGSAGLQLKPGYPEIPAAGVKSKKLLLIIPVNEMNEHEREVMIEMIRYASLSGIAFETITYQRSTRFEKDDENGNTNGAEVSAAASVGFIGLPGTVYAF